MRNRIIFALLLIIFIVPTVVLAQGSPAEFRPLVNIPGLTDTSSTQNNINFSNYIQTLYVLAIAVAGLLAVIKIIIAGFKWMMSDVVTNKSDAKNEIQGAVIGLLIVMATYIILNEINPQLTRTAITVDPITRVPGVTASPTPPGSIVYSYEQVDPCIITGLSGNNVNLDCSAGESQCSAAGGTFTRPSRTSETPQGTCRVARNVTTGQPLPQNGGMGTDPTMIAP
jgi:hypothetical protein